MNSKKQHSVLTEFGKEIKAKVFEHFEITDLKTDTELEKVLIFLDSELEKN